MEGLLTPGQWQELRAIEERHPGEREHAAGRPQETTCRGRTGGGGGGVRLTDSSEASFSYSFKGDSTYLEALFIGRADERIHGSPTKMERPDFEGASRMLTGGPMGWWWMLYNRENHIAWVDTTAVPLREDNVVLVQGVDRLHDRPTIVGTIRIPAAVPMNGCSLPEWPALRDFILSHPEIAEFIEAGP